MLKEGRTYHIITKDGSELIGTVIELLTRGRVILEDVFILTKLGAQLFVKKLHYIEMTQHKYLIMIQM